MAQLGLAPTVCGTTARLVVIGDLTARTTASVRQAVDELLDEGVTSLTLDLRKAVVVDKESVDVLLAVSAAACEGGVSVRLCADEHARELLETAKATALFAAIDEALAAAHSVRSLLDVCEHDGDDASEIEAVTWIATDEPSVPA